MKNLNLGIIAGTLTRPALLRADRIRRDTLTMLAAALRDDPDNSVRNALDTLIDAVANPADAEGAEIDALVADIEDLADMGRATIALTDGDVRQLAHEAAAAANLASGAVVQLPVQRDRRAS